MRPTEGQREATCGDNFCGVVVRLSKPSPQVDPPPALRLSLTLPHRKFGIYDKPTTTATATATATFSYLASSPYVLIIRPHPHDTPDTVVDEVCIRI